MKRTKTPVAVVATALVVLALLSVAPVSGVQKLKKKKEKRFEPVVKQRVEEYAGRYVGIAPDYYLEVAPGADGKLHVTSQEGSRRATLRDVRLTGARLTATRVYADGATADFEATFANRILNGESSFGIMLENINVEFDGITFNRIFYRLDPNP